MTEKILLIDGSSLLFRAFYAIRDLSTSEGIMTNGVYGFLTMYINAFNKFNPDYVLVAFDRKSKTFRHEQFKDYKATREKIPNEINHQFAILRNLLDYMNIKHLDVEGFEADDIVGTYAKLAKKENLEVIIITGDRDYLQLVDENTTVYYTLRGVTQMKEYTPEIIWEDYNIKPIQLIDVKALMGDKSDNIPGVEGIGEKTALKYIREYGNLENLYQHIDDFKNKAKEKLENGKMSAFLSLTLGKIVTDCPVGFSIEDLKLRGYDQEKLEQELLKLEFNSFIPKLITEKVEDNTLDSNFIYDYDLKFIDELKKEKEIYFDIFTDGDNYHFSKATYLALSKKDDSTVYIYDYNEEIVKKSRDIFENTHTGKVSYDIKRNIVLLKKSGVDLRYNYEDLMLMHYLIDPSLSEYTLKQTASNILSINIADKNELFKKARKKVDISEIEKDKLFDFISRNLQVLKRLKNVLLKKLDEYEMRDLYRNVELKLTYVLAQMEYKGFVCKKEVLEKLSVDIVKEIKDISEEIYMMAGEEFNINSPKQLGVILFEKIKLPIIKKTKTGYSTNQKVLDKLRQSHPIIEKIESYRSLSKLYSTYIEGLEKSIAEDGRIHTTFKQIAATGRISSTEPNLQNLPIRSGEGRKIRKAFQADENHVLVDADYSQIELRVLAHMADDPKMIEYFKKGYDIHQKTASEVFHVDEKEVTKDMRSKAKAVNFGIIYGISDYGLSQNLSIPRMDAKVYIDNYLNAFPNIKKYMKDVVSKAKDLGYTTTLFNRRRYVPELNDKNFNIRGFGERIALNTPIQGSAADIIKIAMIDVYERLEREKIDCSIILQIHDEIILESSYEDRQRAREILVDCMQNAVKLKVDLSVDANIGKDMYESK